ncbi:MAG: nuclear transport factor 2 family protein [Myxococcota bacterium]|nr:nuclear transport factor 2 family protein [Myxococcota bacterium]
MDQAIREIRDRLEIQDLMNRYSHMVDQREWALMDRVFAPGAEIDYTSTGGARGDYRQTLEWLDRALEPWPLNLHFITNLVVDLDGDRARSRCYFHAPMGRVEEDGSQLVITNAGWYDDELVRTEAGWRIAKRDCRQTIMIGSLPEGYEIPR